MVAWAALGLVLVALSYCYRHGLMLLYGDAVAHLYIARRVLDSRNPGFRQLGSVWLPLPHLLLLPFVRIGAWWRSGLAGALVSIPSYVLACAGLYRLARVWLSIPIALVAAALFAFNPGLLYMSTTAMTEPLFLAEVIWAVLLIVLFEQSLDSDPDRLSRSGSGLDRPLSANRLLISAGLVLVAAIFTRYDGWIFAAAAWIVVTAGLTVRIRRVFRAWIVFTLLLVAAPAAWLVYNAKIFGDPLDFMRGPYSAQAIEARTSHAGSAHHPGFHSMPVAGLYFLKAAEMGVVPVRFGNALLWLSLAGTLAAFLCFRRRRIWPVLLLWIPLPFYAYSIAYGSVPIFIPLWWPFSWYNTRYGMELLPAFALFVACLFGVLVSLAPRMERWVAPLLVLLIALDAIVLTRARPLVFQEAVANSRTRIPFERILANALTDLPAAGTVLMYTSQDAGAVQQSGISLRRVVNEGDYREWQQALDDPAHSAAIVVALDGDAVARAVQQHPQGLQLMQVICATGQPCARIYQSQLYTPPYPALPAQKGAGI